METETTDFAQRQKEARENLRALLTVRDVRAVLSCSANVVIDLIRRGELDAYDLIESRRSAEMHPRDTNGIRISPESLQRYLASKMMD